MPRVQPADDLPQIVASARVIDLASQSEATAGPAQIHPHDPDTQRKQQPADPDDVVRVGTTCQSVHENRSRHARLPSRGHRLENEQPVAVGQRNLVGMPSSSRRPPPMYRPTIVCA